MALESFQVVNQSDGPPPKGWCQLFAYDGSNQLEYQGWAPSDNELSEWTRDAGTLTSIVDAANTATVTTSSAHGLMTGARVYVENAADADLDGNYVITVTGAATFTFTTANVTDATYNEGGLRIWTKAPRTNRPVWSIKKYVYSGANLTEAHWAEGQSQTFKYAWDSRTTYAYQ